MDRTFQGIVRTTFVLDADKRIIKVWENVKPEGHAEEVLQYLQRHKAPAHGGEEVRLREQVTMSRSRKRAEGTIARAHGAAAKGARTHIR